MAIDASYDIILLNFSAKNNVLMVNGVMLVAIFANVKMKERVIQLMALAPVKVTK